MFVCSFVFWYRKVQLDKKHFCLDDAIGKPYGTTWEPSGKGLQQITPDCEPEEGDGQGMSNF